MHSRRFESLRNIFVRLITQGTLPLVLGALLAVLLYVYLLNEARLEFGAGRILGWDTLVYAFSAQETLIQGMGWLIDYWGHPNAYVVTLAGAVALAGDVTIPPNYVPLVLIGGLSLASGYLANKIGGIGAAVLAVGLTATSFATLRMFVDLHRALLAFTLVTVLIGLGSFRGLSAIRLGRAGMLSLALLFIVVFSEFEIYLAFLATIILTAATRASMGGP